MMPWEHITKENAPFILVMVIVSYLFARVNHLERRMKHLEAHNGLLLVLNERFAAAYEASRLNLKLAAQMLRRGEVPATTQLDAWENAPSRNDLERTP
jgi:hypothetical protein